MEPLILTPSCWGILASMAFGLLAVFLPEKKRKWPRVCFVAAMVVAAAVSCYFCSKAEAYKPAPEDYAETLHRETSTILDNARDEHSRLKRTGSTVEKLNNLIESLEVDLSRQVTIAGQFSRNFKGGNKILNEIQDSLTRIHEMVGEFSMGNRDPGKGGLVDAVGRDVDLVEANRSFAEVLRTVRSRFSNDMNEILRE